MTRETLSHITQKVTQVLPVVLFACALYIVHNQLKVHDINDILSSVKAMSLPVVEELQSIIE